MAKVVAGMTMSVDGFVNDIRNSMASLYSDFKALVDSGPLKESIQKTGAVVMGKNSFAPAEDPDWYAFNYEFQVSIFVVTHEIPSKHHRKLTN